MYLSLTVIFSILATAGIVFAVACLAFNFIFRKKKWVIHENCVIFNPQRACAASVTVLGLCVCVSVCVSVTQHLTFHKVIRATNDTNLLSGGWRSKILSNFLWKCFVAKLECFLLVQLHDKSAIFYFAENAHVYESGPCCYWTFCSGKDVLCEFDYWPLAVCLQPRYAHSVKLLYL